MGNLKKSPDKSEKRNAVNLRRSPYLTRHIKKNEKINTNDVIWLRPFKKTSLSPFEFLKKKNSKKKFKKGDFLIKKNLK